MDKPVCGVCVRKCLNVAVLKVCTVCFMWIQCVTELNKVGGREFQLTSTKRKNKECVCDVAVDGDFITFCNLRPISDRQN